jgi:predicted AlkP superfamily phosphohydrolase/phosphomutase
MSAGAAKKMLMLGVDAGDLRFISSSIDRLPNFRRLLEAGVCRKLGTTSNLLTGSVWPTFYTGKHPGEHGVYHHLQWDPSAMSIRRVSADWLYCEPFWYELTRQGVKVTVLDVPMTFRSVLQTGVEVINWGAHDQLGPFHSNRPDIARDIRRQFGSHPMGPEIPVQKTVKQVERIRRDLVTGAERKGDMIRWLLQATEWELFLAVFGECHRGGHILWPESGPSAVVSENDLLDVYQAVDRAIGCILECVDQSSTGVVLFSLHGMQANKSQEHFVPGIMQLANSGFLRTTSEAGPAPGERRSLMKHLRKTLPARLQHAIARAVPVGVRDWVVCRATSGGYDWRHTPGFALLADYNGYLRFNLAGREKLGCLPAQGDTSKRYADWLKNSFSGLSVCTTGLPLVRSIVSPGEIFPGIRSSSLPDLIVTWEDSDPATEVASAQLGHIRAHLDTGRSGNHRHEGFVAAIGANAGQWQSAEHILDLAPLLMRAYQAQ